jgi:hypothetical protein
MPMPTYAEIRPVKSVCSNIRYPAMKRFLLACSIADPDPGSLFLSGLHITYRKLNYDNFLQNYLTILFLSLQNIQSTENSLKICTPLILF